MAVMVVVVVVWCTGDGLGYEGMGPGLTHPPETTKVRPEIFMV